jgi:hypothetical protein
MLAIFSSVGANGSESPTLPGSCTDGAGGADSADAAGVTVTMTALAVADAEAPGGARSEQATTVTERTAPVVVRTKPIVSPGRGRPPLSFLQRESGRRGEPLDLHPR